ncbi:Crp/Fnr family transcriptional regulator [Sporichthya sp.]|uniref:Crp/Fnr family transcriptional regulator n=1 Tax=Sporichthya sp. TaxID=65475 RepID=UPI0017F4E92C|nr:Crp/Fnr family transcriptional regulator [Sporichthya sp.]MBA3745353.1 Crp/Fnr family transcriptional regulator [Sporichthya sp.]
MDEGLTLSQGLPEREFAPGEDILGEGEISGELHVLLHGTVGIEVHGVLVKRVSDPGSFLGEISALLGTTHSARVYAIESCRTRVMAADAIRSNPDLLLGVARLLAARLQAMTGYLADLRTQYADSEDHLSLMADVLSELTAARPTSIAPGSTRDGYDH